MAAENGQKVFAITTNEGRELRPRTLASTVVKSDILDRYFHSNFFNRKAAATGAGGRVGFPASLTVLKFL